MKLLLVLIAMAAADSVFIPSAIPLDTEDLLPQTAVNDRYILRERWAKINLGKLVKETNNLEFNLFEDAVFEVATISIEKNAHGFYLYEGAIPAADFSSVTVTFDESLTVGHIQADGSVFEIRPVQDAVRIIEIDQDRFPNEAEPPVIEEVDETAVSEEDYGYVYPDTPRPRSIDLLQSNVIDILHLEPSRTQAGCNNINFPALESQYQNHLNSAWRTQYGVNSRVMARCLVRNVTNNFSSELSALRNSAAVARVRNDLRADLVALVIVASGNICGIAYKPSLPVRNSDQNTAFSVDARSCAIPNWTYIHEFGHNLGLNHDRHMTGGGASQCNFGGFNNWSSPTTRSVMSYNNRCSQVFGRSCRRVGTYSNGGSLGRRCGGTSTGEDCISDVYRSVPVVSSYR